MPAPDAPSRDALLQDSLAAALDFYRHVGVDIALGEASRNFFAESEAAAAAKTPSPLAGRVASVSGPGGAPRQADFARAAAQRDLRDPKSAVADFGIDAQTGNTRFASGK
ncbi:MAG: hypothetical protein H6872_04420 [Methylobacteriaceae bacterium]|nr:hypothetical protein [Methylobacteriaceae bacterium]